MSTIMVAGATLFMIVALAMPRLKGGGYSGVADSISEGALGRYGSLQTVAFVLLGLTSLALAKLVADNTDGRLGSVAAVLLVVWSVGVLVCGAFRVDAGAEGATTAAKIHLGAAFGAFVAGLAAVWLTTFAVRGQAGQPGVFGWSLALAIACTVAFLVTGAAPRTASWGGLAQRVFTALLLAWMSAIALALPSSS
jgi:hypothetical protein